MPAYNEMSYDKLLLDGLRLVSYTPGGGPLTNEGLIKAMTMNENLKTLGYTLNPQDIIRIAQSPSADKLYENVRSMMSDVKAKPMYPDFPTQVMEMDEAQFRMHQMIHYFSTYGLEFITGIEVEKGWLPAEDDLVSDTEKTKEDTSLLSAKVLELVPEGEKYSNPFGKILAKRERMTDMEREIVKRCAESGTINFDSRISVPFKENLKDTFMLLAQAGADGKITRQQASNALFNICQHPGDVTENLHHYLAKNHYSLRTAEKKMFVSLYDRFSNAAFRGNLIVPRSRENFTREIFRHIGFTKYTKSKEKAKAVRDIGKERTWEAKARDMITSHDPDAIKFAAQRPGMLIRMTSMALRNGYSEEEIVRELSKKSTEISAQTLVSQVYAARKGPTDTQSMGAERTKKALDREIAGIRNTEAILAVKERKKEAEKPFGYTIGSVWPGEKTNAWSAKESGIRTALSDRREKLKEKRNRVDEKERERIEERNSTYAAQDRIFTAVLKDRLGKVKTGLEGKTVFVDTLYDLERMPLDPVHKKMSQGYLPPAVMKIPEGVDRIRCFVYWNDRRRVDLDLHAYAKGKNGEQVHIGWNSDFRNSGICTSGDITHSNAAEYIDVDLSEAKSMLIDLQLNSYTGEHFFDINTCFTGIMAVDQIGKEVKLYDPKNCFASMDITNDSRNISVAELNTGERTISFSCKDREMGFNKEEQRLPPFSIRDYVNLSVEAGGGRLTDDPEKADVILTLTKPASEKEVSLIGNNYFFEAKQREDEVRTSEKAQQIEAETQKEEQRQQEEEQQRHEEEIQEEREEIDPRNPFNTEFTKVFIIEGGIAAARAFLAETPDKAIVVMDPKTEKVYVADKNNPDGYQAKGKSLVKVVMGIEDRAALRDYARVMRLYKMRGELKDRMEAAKEKLGIRIGERDAEEPVRI